MMRDYAELILGLRRHHCDAKEDDTQEVCEECAYNVIVADKSFSGITDVCTCGLMHRAADAIEELLAVCRDVAAFVIHYADDDEVSAEVLCRKLHKIGVVEKDGAWWTLPKAPKEVE